MLEDYAKANGFTNCVHFTDDGWSGGSFDRPSWKRMIEGIGKGEIAAVLVKDLSRVGRDYLQVGFYTEVMFREKGVRFVAITNGVDSDKRESSEFAPFLNIMNEWYIRDCSRKITSVLRARGMSGKHTSNHCIYGYKKDPNDKDHWIIDEEAAEVVRRIYRMAIEGKGPYEIARILATEKVERPSYYLAQRGMGNHQSNYNAADPYTWRGGTVADILSKQEYMGHTVNFRTYKESYKDKRVKMTPKEDLVIFENTQEAIIDKETWERVQTLRKTIRRTDSIGKANPLTGLMFCADCGAKMYNHRGKAGNARDWAGRPNGKKRPDRDEYNCSRYDLGNQHYDKYCTTHLIRTAVVNELLLEAIKGVCDYALNNEAEFMAQVCSASEDRQEKAARSIRQRKQRNEKRTDELTRLIRKLYEDNVSGRLPDTLFEQMLRDFEAELSDLTEIVSQDQQELERISRETINAEKFLSLVRKYTDFSELTPAMINEFVEKILVHQAQGKGASRIQEIEIFFNFVGKVDIPHKEVELTEEEKAALPSYVDSSIQILIRSPLLFLLRCSVFVAACIAVLVISPSAVALQIGKQMIACVLEFIAVQPHPHEPDTEREQFIVAHRLAHDAGALGDGLRRHGKTQIDVGFCATGVQRRIEAAPFNGAAIKDRMQVQRIIARPVVMLVRRNAAFVPDVFQLRQISRWFIGQPPCPLQHGFAHALTPAVDTGRVCLECLEQQILFGIHDTEQVLETLAVMIGSIHMDVHSAGVVDFSACLPDTAHTLLEFFHFVIGELRRYHLHAIFRIGRSAIAGYRLSVASLISCMIRNA